MKALIDAESLPTDRLCKVCETVKVLEEFSNNPQCNFGKTHTCKECVCNRSRKHYLENTEKKLVLANERNRRLKDKAIKFMGGKCTDCEGKFHRCVYDFHHTDGMKEMNPSYALTMKWERAVKELEKCVLLCANCHRMRHFKEVEENESVN